MKKWILPLLAALLAAVSCGVLGETREERAAREAREAQMVYENVQAGDFVIDIDRMIPIRGSSHHVNSYSVRVKDGVLTSYLPYIGRAYQIPYGGGKGLNFSERIGSYQESQKKNGQRHIEIGVKNDEDTYLYTIEVWDNGSSQIEVQPRQRERITYSGDMIFDRK